MLSNFITFQDLFKNKKIKFNKQEFERILYKFHFHNIVENFNERIFLPLEYSNDNTVLIDYYEESENGKFIFFCFDYNIILLNQSDEPLLKNIFLSSKTHNVYNIREESNSLLYQEIIDFSSKIEVSNHEIRLFWKIIINILSGFLIMRGYHNSKIDRMSKNYLKFSKKGEKLNITQENYISIKKLGSGSGGIVEKVFLIQQEKIYAIKCTLNDQSYLIEREITNYLSINHPYIVKYFGFFEINHKKYLLLEYIPGKTLNNFIKEEKTN